MVWRGNVHCGERLPEQLTKLTKGAAAGALVLSFLLRSLKKPSQESFFALNAIPLYSYAIPRSRGWWSTRRL
jgi:hypothetical protein